MRSLTESQRVAIRATATDVHNTSILVRGNVSRSIGAREKIALVLVDGKKVIKREKDETCIRIVPHFRISADVPKLAAWPMPSRRSFGFGNLSGHYWAS